MTGTALDAVDPFVFRLSIFVLAVFVGYYVVWSVTPALHTRADVGDQCHLLGDRRGRAACRGRRARHQRPGPHLGPRARLRRAGVRFHQHLRGFLVTQRMLAMYQKKKK